MSDLPPDDPQVTQPVPPEPAGRRPAPTERIRVARQRRPPPSLWAFLGLLVGAGLLIGFVLGHFIGRPRSVAFDPNLVLFEPASSTIPFAGAEFTANTFDPQRGTCDRARLKQLLRADQRRFNAWIRLVGIDATQFDAFVDRLETAKLAGLSPVTNHGCFASGECPFSFQSVLASGTPVWRDPAQGRIVAKCGCSNPLSAPQCPPNCNSATAAPAAATPAPTRAEQTLPPASPSRAPTTPAPTPPPAATPEPVATATPP